MNYIDFVVRNKHIESRQNAIIADNTDYVFRFTFLGKWTEFETKTVLMLREDGKFYRCDMKNGATSLMLPKFTSPLTLLIGVTAGGGEDEISTDRLLFNVRSSIRTGANEELEKPESGAEDFLAEYCRRYDELLLKLETLDDVYILPSVTSADAGKVLRVSAAGEWEAADAASGEDWEFINEISTNEWISSVTINQDSNGNPFSLKKMRIFMTLPKTTNEAGEEQSNPGYAHYKVNDRNPAWQSPSSYWESGLFLWTIEAFGDYYIVSCWKDGANSSTLHHIDVFHDAGYFESITSFTWKLFNANYGWGSTNFKVYGVKA